MKKIMGSIKAIIWQIIYTPIYGLQYCLTAHKRKRLPVMDSVQTCSFIATNNCSVSRFGDGEFQMISHWLAGGTKGNFGVDSFQEYDSDLASRLSEVLASSVNNLLVCIPYPFKNATVYRGYDRLFFKREYLSRKELISKYSPKVGMWGDTDFTRFYLHRTDIHSVPEYILKLKSIWDNKRIIIVEGKFSRLGVGNDLFDNTLNIERIICPPKNAYASYKNILDTIMKYAADKMVLLALGQTATVLSYDLSQKGIRSIDLGHIDIEYEWYRMGAKKKVPVQNKYVNEVESGRICKVEDNASYQRQVICEIQ